MAEHEGTGALSALADLKEYRIAESYAKHRLIKRREPNPEYAVQEG